MKISETSLVKSATTNSIPIPLHLQKSSTPTNPAPNPPLQTPTNPPTLPLNPLHPPSSASKVPDSTSLNGHASVTTHQPTTKTQPKVKKVKVKEDTVATKNRTEKFLHLRTAHRQRLEEQINEMLSNLAQLSLRQMEMELSKKANASLTPQPKRKLDKCARCGSPFDWSWMKLREVKNVCYLCRDVFCDSCGTSTIDLHTINATDDKQKREARVCLNCTEIVNVYYRRINWEQQKRQTELNPIVNYYRDTTALRGQVLSLIDKYIEIVSTLSIIEEERFKKAKERLEETISSTVPLSEPAPSLTNAFFKSASIFKSFFSSSNLTPNPPPAPPTSRSQPSASATPTSQEALPGSQSAFSLAVKPPSMPSEIDLAPAHYNSAELTDTPEKLYSAADQLEKQIIKSMNTYVQGVKLLSEIVVESEQESEVIKLVKKAAIENITENALSHKNMKKLLVGIETRVLESVCVTLSHLSSDLTVFAFSGVLRNPIERCLSVVREELKAKLDAIGESWNKREKELEETIKEELASVKRGETKSYLAGLPANATVKRQAEKVVSIVTQLSGMLSHSVSNPYLVDSRNAFQKLLEEIQDYT